MTRAGCWPTPTTVMNPCWSQAASGQQEAAADIASTILWYGTGGQFDLCPVVYRPCERCQCGCAFWTLPYILNGEWRNGCGSCADWCCGVYEVILPSTAYEVLSVDLNGDEVTNYHIDNYRRLVHEDGEPWPHCQDMDALPGSPNTFTVTYVQSRLDAAGVHAYAALAGEIVTSWLDPPKCRLPQGITSVTREGITIDFSVLGSLASRTGIIEVDLWLRMVNPTGQPNAQSIVMSPETLRLPRGRSTTKFGPTP